MGYLETWCKFQTFDFFLQISRVTGFNSIVVSEYTLISFILDLLSFNAPQIPWLFHVP